VITWFHLPDRASKTALIEWVSLATIFLFGSPGAVVVDVDTAWWGDWAVADRPVHGSGGVDTR
jgi:hypothetical protein